MRAVAVVMALALAGCASEADEPESAEDRALTQELCREMSTLAATTMRGRQEGASMADLMDRTGDTEAGEYSRALITEAFSRRRYHTEDSQERAITDFSNEIYLACISA